MEGLIEVLREDRQGRRLGKKKVDLRRLCVAKLKALELEMSQIEAEFVASRASERLNSSSDNNEEEVLGCFDSSFDGPGLSPLKLINAIAFDDGDLLS